MAMFYKPGEEKERPGVYIQIIDRGVDGEDVEFGSLVRPNEPPPPKFDTDGITVSYDATSKTATLFIPGGIVSTDGNGTVILLGVPAPASYDDNGNAKIGG